MAQAVKQGKAKAPRRTRKKVEETPNQETQQEAVEQKAQEETKEEVKEETKPSKEPRGKTQYGHIRQTMAGDIDELVIKGTTASKIINHLMEKHGRDEAHAKAKFKAHVNHLKKMKGVPVVENDGVYSIGEKPQVEEAKQEEAQKGE